MDDRQLLEDAARALGYSNVLRWDEKLVCLTDYEGWTFNPLEDDGDSAHMESALSLDVQWQTHHVIVGRTILDKWQEPYANHRLDKQAARRYAGTRAAAAIGQKMREAGNG